MLAFKLQFAVLPMEEHRRDIRQPFPTSPYSQPKVVGERKWKGRTVRCHLAGLQGFAFALEVAVREADILAVDRVIAMAGPHLTHRRRRRRHVWRRWRWRRARIRRRLWRAWWRHRWKGPYMRLRSCNRVNVSVTLPLPPLPLFQT